MSLLRALETAYRGLVAQQQAVETTSHNIANASTPGFSRQRVDLVTTPPYTVPALNRSTYAGQVGTGVVAQTVSRVREAIFDQQYREQSHALGEANPRVDAYDQLQAVFNEPSTNGLSALLDRFWNAWQDVTNQPEDLAARASLVQEATTLATNINRTRSQLKQLQGDFFQKLSLQVDEVNSLASRIAALNKQIVAVLAVGQTPNDLEDQRDQLLDQLAQYADITVTPQTNGALDVDLGGMPLVSYDQAFSLAVTLNGGQVEVDWQGGGPATLGRGSLQALVDLYNTTVPGMLTQIEQIRDALANQVNALHQTGYGLTDPAGPPPNRPFFLVDAAGDLQVNPVLVAHPEDVAASSQAQLPGNADVALQIANLRQALVMNNNTATIGDFYNTMIAQLGGDARESQVTQQNQQTLVDAIDRQRKQISGVSLDEEMANLVKFQHAYEAAARAITAVDEMLDKVINGMGVVGR